MGVKVGVIDQRERIGLRKVTVRQDNVGYVN